MIARRTVLAALACAALATPAFAQTYPNKPIHLIVPYPAGGGTDFFARLVGQKMQELIGQPVVVENKPGAATNLGADFVAKAQPDGYTHPARRRRDFRGEPEPLQEDPVRRREGLHADHAHGALRQRAGGESEQAEGAIRSPN